MLESGRSPPVDVLEEVVIAGGSTDGMLWHRAWPALEVLEDGTLLVAYKQSGDHSRSDDAAVFVARSADGGMTWPWRRALAAAPGWGYITNHGMTRLSGGEILCPLSRYQHFTPPDPQTGLTRILHCAFTRSIDGGQTWGPCGAELLFEPLTPLHGTVFGRVQELSGGRLMVPVFGVPRAARDRRLRTAGVAFSEDVGRTWTDFVPICDDRRGDVCPSETDVIRLADGRYLAMIRANAVRRLIRSYSADEGQTSTPPEPTTPPGQCPSLLTLASGDLLCAYRDMTEGRAGMSCAVTSDGGETWTAPTRLYDGENFDCSYPSLVRLPDGRLNCAFYTAAMPAYSGTCEIHGLLLACRSAAR